MADNSFKVPEKLVEPSLEDTRDGTTKNNNADNSGFGLVNWLFDHVREREPIFLSLYKSYDKEVKFSNTKFSRFLGAWVLIGCYAGDGLVFAIYAAAIVAIIVGITFIFVKGTGVLDYFLKQTTTIQTNQVQIESPNVQIRQK